MEDDNIRCKPPSKIKHVDLYGRYIFPLLSVSKSFYAVLSCGNAQTTQL